ncbi:hypothetical protein [Echinicola vietnamensis]|uniref:Uncharacterized protein n=1 Tax=Echinicola vietnamensis (strain DSM 17526 / LMG 23754 / KMM 6221) TaxID=926556 RepID=L0FUM5_ECHVK|nr:hypothetical protein [Echinicola vietnamensis]AGA76992.1 hypothetical protein Echvi_0715 [Echinicola vietnamensis DSM 17526]
MENDFINTTLKTYLGKRKNIRVIQRYLRIKYHVHIEEAILRKRASQLNIRQDTKFA